MKGFELAVKVIVEDLSTSLKEDYSEWDIQSWNEMLNAFGFNSNDMKEEIEFVLEDYSKNSEEKVYLTDDGEIIDNEIHSYRQLVNAVKKELFGNKKDNAELKY